jgi:hypothetical protein
MGIDGGGATCRLHPVDADFRAVVPRAGTGACGVRPFAALPAGHGAIRIARAYQVSPALDPAHRHGGDRGHMRLRATTRLPPHVWPTNANIANSRLSFPVTYWNVLGLLAPFGIVLWLPAEPVTSGRDSSIQATTARLEMWRIARHEFRQVPIVGKGAGTFKIALLNTDHERLRDNTHSLCPRRSTSSGSSAPCRSSGSCSRSSFEPRPGSAGRTGRCTPWRRHPCGSRSASLRSRVARAGAGERPLDQALAGADAVVLVTAHPDIGYQAIAEQATLFIDLRGITRGPATQQPGPAVALRRGRPNRSGRGLTGELARPVS